MEAIINYLKSWVYPDFSVQQVDEPNNEYKYARISSGGYKFPRQTAFIIFNEFCERFAYYGIRSVLVLYLSGKLHYSVHTSISLFHVFNAVVYGMCICGAVVSDSWLGKYKTILVSSIIYLCGSLALLSSSKKAILIPQKPMCIIGLLLIAIGCGSRKPCHSAFGGDQFKLPEQTVKLSVYFSLFYCALNAGAFVAQIVSPILRADVMCFGEPDCFILSFGLATMVLTVGLVVFSLGKFMYILRPKSGNIIMMMCGCMKDAIKTKRRVGSEIKHAHLVDYAGSKYSDELKSEILILFKVLILYIPLPMFWALLEQTASTWTFQATHMSGYIGGDWQLKPDHMQVMNSFLVICFIPLYNLVLYPLLAKIKIQRPLQKMTMGGILAGMAFICSALLERQLEKTYDIKPSTGLTQLRIYNPHPCPYTLDVPSLNNLRLITVNESSIWADNYIKVNSHLSVEYTLKGECGPEYNGHLNLKSSQALGLFLKSGAALPFEDNTHQSDVGNPVIRVFGSAADSLDVVISTGNLHVKSTSHNHNRIEFAPGKYTVSVEGQHLGKIKLEPGGVYALFVSRDNIDLATVTNPNSIHMLWQLPQYILLALGEVAYSATGIEFSYSQAPPSMKSALQAAWLMTIAIGNVVVAILSVVMDFESIVWEFLVYASLMFVDMAIFALLANQYTVVSHVND